MSLMMITKENGKSVLKTIESKESPTLKDYQKLVDGYIETVMSPIGYHERNIVILVNEEGIFKSLPITAVVTYSQWGHNTTFLYGNVVFCRAEGEELLALTDEQMQYIETALQYNKLSETSVII